jgi:hypothetical protein
MVCYVKYAIRLWFYTASLNLIIILGRFMEIARRILNPRLLLVIWVIWDTSDLFLDQRTSFMCFVTEIRILFVSLEDISGSLASNLRRKRSIVRVDYLSHDWTPSSRKPLIRHSGAFARPSVTAMLTIAAQNCFGIRHRCFFSEICSLYLFLCNLWRPQIRSSGDWTSIQSPSASNAVWSKTVSGFANSCEKLSRNW